MALLISWKIDTAILVATLIVAIYLYLTRNFDHWKKKGVFYLKPIPFFGNFQDVCFLRTSVAEFLQNIYNSSKEDIIGFFIFDEPCLLIRNPALAKMILVKDFDCFCDRSIAENHRDDPISSSMMFVIKNPEWKSVRSKVTPFFTGGKMKQMFHLMNTVGKNMSEYVGRVCINEEETEAKELCSKFSTDLITSTAFGVDANCFTSEDAKFRELSRKIIEFNFLRSIQMLIWFFAPKLVKPFRMKFFDPEAAQFLKEALAEIITEREKCDVKRNDLIDILIQVKKDVAKQKIQVDENKVLAQAIQFFVVGYEPVSGTVAFALYELALHLDIQNRLREEIYEVLERYGGELTYDAVQEMEYLSMVIAEVHRKYPMLSFVERRCMKRYRIPDTDVFIEEGTSVNFSLYAVQMDPEYFPDPDRFDPDRFSKENKEMHVPFTYVPFGEGPHNCIGERYGLLGSKVGVIHILLEYEVIPTKTTPVPLVWDPKAFLLTSKDGLPVHLRRITKAN